MIQLRSRQLPKEIVRPARIRGILISLLGSLLVVFGANLAAINYMQKSGINWGDRIVAHKWHMLLDMKSPVDWLILGDSSGATSVVPSILDGRLGGTSINLCTHGALGILNDAWMLDEYIQRLGPPRHVLLVHCLCYTTISHAADLSVYSMMQIPLSWGFWDRLEPRVLLPSGRVPEAFLDRYVPLYSHTDTLGSTLKNPWTAYKQDGPSFQDDGLLLVTGSTPLQVEAQAAEYLSSITGTESTPDAMAQQTLEHIAALAEEFDFDVYLASGPMYAGVYQDPGFQAYVSGVRDYLDAFTASHKRVRQVLRAPITFPADQMQTTSHPVASGAPMYTEQLVSEIMQCEESP